MKITLVGNFNSDTLECSYRDAFQKLGHVIRCIDTRSYKEDLAWWLKDRITHRLTINNYLLRSLGSERYNLMMLSQILESKPNFALIFGGECLLAQTVATLQKSHIQVAIINGDNPYAPHYASRPEMLPTAKECDAYFIWSELLAMRLKKDGIPSHFLPFAWDEAVFPYVGNVEHYQSEVSFIGGWDKEREHFLDIIAKHFPLRIWGHDYWQSRTSSSSTAKKVWQGMELRASKAAQMIAHSKINLNVLRKQHHTDGVPDGVIMRTFEVPGTGGFSLATRSGGAKEILEEGRAAGYFANVEECLNQIDYYLSHEEQRKKMALHAHDLVASKHRYEHRAQKIIDIMFA
jgi:spore maturation protein CgeB